MRIGRTEPNTDNKTLTKCQYIFDHMFNIYFIADKIIDFFNTSFSVLRCTRIFSKVFSLRFEFHNFKVQIIINLFYLYLSIHQTHTRFVNEGQSFFLCVLSK